MPALCREAVWADRGLTNALWPAIMCVVGLTQEKPGRHLPGMATHWIRQRVARRIVAHSLVKPKALYRSWQRVFATGLSPEAKNRHHKILWLEVVQPLDVVVQAPVAQVDRALASGARCTGSSPVGGTFLLRLASCVSHMLTALRKTQDVRRNIIHLISPQPTQPPRQPAPLSPASSPGCSDSQPALSWPACAAAFRPRISRPVLHSGSRRPQQPRSL